MQPPFDFYEHARILATQTGNSHLNGRCGIVVGRTRTAAGDSWYYAVDLDGESGVWCFYEQELEATGQRYTREDLYDGSTIRVKVDEQGRGHVSTEAADD